MKSIFAAFTLALLAVGPAVAASGAADAVSAVDPYVRLVPPGQAVTGAFVVLRNAGDKDHKLVKADSAAARVTELHTHVSEDGMMKMRPVKEIEIKARGETALKPGGLHIMLIDLKQPLKEGDALPITLTFEDGSSRTLEAPARRIQPPSPMPMEHSHGGMKH